MRICLRAKGVSNLKAAGIVCEYNPIHSGHTRHIEETRRALGGEPSAIVCVMSGNFVQRGDFAVFSKHARALAAVRSGADLVVELPSPYALSSAEGFARAGVHILDRLCDYISFGSESGDIVALTKAAEGIVTPGADIAVKEWLSRGVPYAAALQKAADTVLPDARADLFKTPNNLLGIEYLKAIAATGSSLKPITVKRTGGAHDGAAGCSSSALRKMLYNGGTPWRHVPRGAAGAYKEEIAAGRGPVTMKSCEIAMLSRLRAMSIEEFAELPGISEGLDRRFARYAATEPTAAAILEKVKTKRYAMSRIRRMLMCACLGITAADTREPPPYIRVLALNAVGAKLIKKARTGAGLPIITKPASAHGLPGHAGELFCKEAAATDMYVLAYPDESRRFGGQEWLISPCVVRSGVYPGLCESVVGAHE